MQSLVVSTVFRGSGLALSAAKVTAAAATAAEVATGDHTADDDKSLYVTSSLADLIVTVLNNYICPYINSYNVQSL